MRVLECMLGAYASPSNLVFCHNYIVGLPFRQLHYDFVPGCKPQARGVHIH